MRWRWIWTAVPLIAVAIGVVIVISLVVAGIPWPENADAVYTLAGIAPALVGGLLAVRQPENVVGKLLVLIGSAWLLGEASRLYLWMSLHTDLPGTEVAAWLMSWLFAPAWMLVPLLLAVFPSGIVATRWLKWPVRVYVLFVVVFALTAMVVPQSLGAYGQYLASFTNPLGVDALATFDNQLLAAAVDIGSIAAVAFLAVAATVDLVRRWRHSAGVVRLQIRIFALGALTMIMLFVVGALAALGGIPRFLENLVTTLALSAPPLAVGFAVLRYRLYEIDRLISRTVSYALVIGALAVLYAGVAIWLPQTVGLPADAPLLVAAATLAVAALFNPLRRRIQTGVDRRFNRARYDAQQEVDRFTERLRGDVDVEGLAHDVLEVVADTLQPVSMSVWIKDEA